MADWNQRYDEFGIADAGVEPVQLFFGSLVLESVLQIKQGAAVLQHFIGVIVFVHEAPHFLRLSAIFMVLIIQYFRQQVNR